MKCSACGKKFDEPFKNFMPQEIKDALENFSRYQAALRDANIKIGSCAMCGRPVATDNIEGIVLCLKCGGGPG